MQKTSKKLVPKILPREPLTRKALAAIEKYALVRDKDSLHLHYLMVRWVLEAERMRRSDLYAWLEIRGCVWQPRMGSWVKKDKP